MATSESRYRRHAQTLSGTTEHGWTPEDVRSLGMTTDVETAASILGIGRTKAYELAKTGDFPVKVVRVGRRYVVPVPAILRLLEVGTT